MARGGSKKGEKRGAAKGGGAAKNRPGALIVKKPPGRPKGPGRRTMQRVQELLDIAGIVKAEPANVMPKEMLLLGMRQLYAMALDIQKQIIVLLTPIPEARTFQANKWKAERLLPRFTDYMLMASEMAYKAAPLYHARIQAIAQLPGGEKTAGDAISSLMDDIDEAERRHARDMLDRLNGQMLTIEHGPAEPSQH